MGMTLSNWAPPRRSLTAGLNSYWKGFTHVRCAALDTTQAVSQFAHKTAQALFVFQFLRAQLAERLAHNMSCRFGRHWSGACEPALSRRRRERGGEILSSLWCYNDPPA